MDDSNSGAFREAIYEVIENQMRDGTPPETRQTYDRLIAEGYSREETMKMIGFVLSCEISETLKIKQPFKQERYVAALHALPKLSVEDDED